MREARVFGAGAFATAGLLAGLLLGSPAAAADWIDGKTNLVCSAVHVVGCVDASHCLQGPARTFDLPDFLLVDFDKKVVRQTRATGDVATSPIQSLEVTGTQLVLQGIENGHGWTMAVHRDNGKMTTVAVGEELTFSIFGACTAP